MNRFKIIKTEKKNVQVHKHTGLCEYYFYHFEDCKKLVVGDSSCQIETNLYVGVSINPITLKPYQSKTEIKNLYLTGKIWF